MNESDKPNWQEPSKMQLAEDAVSTPVLVIVYDFLRDADGAICDWIVREVDGVIPGHLEQIFAGWVNRRASELFASQALLELTRRFMESARGCKVEVYLPSGQGEEAQAGGHYFLMMMIPHRYKLVTTLVDITEQKRKDEALRESEARVLQLNRDLNRRVNDLQALLDALPMSVCMTEGVNCRAIHPNRFMEAVLGVPPGTDISPRVVADGSANFQFYRNGREIPWEEMPLQMAIATGRPVYNAEYEVVCCDGRKIHFFGHAVPLFDEYDQVRGAIGAYDDVTRHKRIEGALQAQREQLTAANEELQAQREELLALNEELQAQTEALHLAYQELQRKAVEAEAHAEAIAQTRDEAERRAAELDAIISSIAAGVIIYDRSGMIVRMNEMARRILGFTGENASTSYQECLDKFTICKEDGIPYQEAAQTPFYRALGGEIIHDEEMMLSARAYDCTAGGSPARPIWISATTAPIYDNNNRSLGVTFIFSDITARKRRIDDMLASERELLEVTLNSLNEGVVAADPEERIIVFNEAAAALTGFSQEEAIGAPLSKILYILDNKTSEPIALTAAFPKNVGNPILVTQDLREIPIAFSSSPIKTAEERIIGTVTVFQDVSEKQKTELELLKANKLEALGILAGGIAHDFNNVLAAILSNIQLAALKLKKHEDIQAYLANTMETTRKASELTKQLLTFSKGGAPVKKNASLIELVKDTAEFALRGSVTKAEFSIPGNLWACHVDEGQISQVIHNLVINAKQAMPKGGIIRISAANVTFAEESLYNAGNYVKIAVRDTGTGIVKENLPKIFDPFFTTKKDGNGLGLAICYSIITQHDGYIEVESQEGVGTTFLIYLPASGMMVAPAASQKEVAVSKAGLRILLMDDEEIILNAVAEMLQCFGHRVEKTTDGTQAIEAYKGAKERNDPFDIIIMDLTVPGGMGGQEAIAHLRDYDLQVKAIVSSGYANDPIMADYERYGFVGVVSKPYKIDELNRILQRVTSPEQLLLRFL